MMFADDMIAVPPGYPKAGPAIAPSGAQRMVTSTRDTVNRISDGIGEIAAIDGGLLCYHRHPAPAEINMLDTWLERWREGRIGWHEADGNALLKRYWPRLVRGSRVLVPFCGKSVDLLWLATRGLDVSGVEISDIAVRAFFEENDLPYETMTESGIECYVGKTAPVRIYCCDYQDFEAEPFHSLYDRGALVAVPVQGRPAYVEKTRRLLEDDAFRMIITLTYDQALVDGPPFSVSREELLSYWPDLECVFSRNDIDDSPPKFRQAGLKEVIESVWTSA